MSIPDEQLNRLAEEAIINEAKRGALRAEMAGPSGWLKPKLKPTNKLFLRNTIKSALASNKVYERKSKNCKGRKLEWYENHLKEEKRYKRCYIKASTKLKLKDKKEPTDKAVIKKSSFVNEVSWMDEGPLEITSVRQGLQSKKKPKVSNRVLPRNIQFISASFVKM